MAQTKTLPGFRRLPGRSERFVVEATGEEISRRAYDKIRRGGVSNEELAQLNAVLEPDLQLARPARGRTSVVKVEPELRKQIASIRREEKQIARQREEEFKAQKALATKIERAKNKKIRRKKIRKQLLQPGHMGVRISFSDYEEMQEAVQEARKTGVVFAYGLGWHGVDERTGVYRDVTVFTMMTTRTNLSEEEFDAEMQASIEEKSYLIFLNYWMHVAFDKAFADSWAKQHGKGKKVSSMDKYR